VSFPDCASGTNAVAWAPPYHIGGVADEAGEATAPAAAALGSPSAGAGVHFVQRLATAGCDNKVRVWKRDARAAAGGGASASTGGWVTEHTLSGHTGWVRDVAWCPTSGLARNVMASASEDGTVIIWRQDAARGGWTAEALPAFPAPVWRVSFSVAGNLLAVSCGDNSVTLWREGPTGAWAQVSTLPDPALPAPRAVAHG
jgi:protein transport protein SEC13